MIFSDNIKQTKRVELFKHLYNNERGTTLLDPPHSWPNLKKTFGPYLGT